ncbi:hypothetical protein J3R83DRAFT_12544 [Lanmaoa asiatica]|nr:hypothetical protein J3R83DRAFT_12544 [Lanmaoa asiatica]
MTLFKVPLLFLSSISYHIALDYPSLPEPEDKIILNTSNRERIWRYAGMPTNVFLRVNLLDVMWSMNTHLFD